MDNLYAEAFTLKYVKKHVQVKIIMEECVYFLVQGDLIVVAPGVGGVLFAKRIADKLESPLAIIHFGTIVPGIPSYGTEENSLAKR